MGAALAKKAQKRTQSTWQLSDATILLLMLEDASLEEIRWVFDPDLRDEWASYGFQEIWVADYTGLEAFGDVELFGLHPTERWGYHPRVFRKPFG